MRRRNQDRDQSAVHAAASFDTVSWLVNGRKNAFTHLMRQLNIVSASYAKGELLKASRVAGETIAYAEKELAQLRLIQQHIDGVIARAAEDINRDTE